MVDGCDKDRKNQHRNHRLNLELLILEIQHISSFTGASLIKLRAADCCLITRISYHHNQQQCCLISRKTKFNWPIGMPQWSIYKSLRINIYINWILNENHTLAGYDLIVPHLRHLNSNWKFQIMWNLCLHVVFCRSMTTKWRFN